MPSCVVALTRSVLDTMPMRRNISRATFPLLSKSLVRRFAVRLATYVTLALFMFADAALCTVFSLRLASPATNVCHFQHGFVFVMAFEHESALGNRDNADHVKHFSYVGVPGCAKYQRRMFYPLCCVLCNRPSDRGACACRSTASPTTTAFVASAACHRSVFSSIVLCEFGMMACNGVRLIRAQLCAHNVGCTLL